jgi:hypothetical protein
MNMRDFVPFAGLGDLTFNMTRSEVRQMLDTPYDSFQKVPWAQKLTDAYDSQGFHLYYDSEDRLELIEAFRPCDPTYRGLRLLRASLKRTLNELAEMGYTTEYEDEGYNFKSLGFVLYVPHTYKKIEAVSLYRLGHYPA